MLSLSSIHKTRPLLPYPSLSILHLQSSNRQTIYLELLNIMRFTFYEHQPYKDNLHSMVLTVVAEPSDTSASVISPQDPVFHGGHVSLQAPYMPLTEDR